MISGNMAQDLGSGPVGGTLVLRNAQRRGRVSPEDALDVRFGQLRNLGGVPQGEDLFIDRQHGPPVAVGKLEVAVVGIVVLPGSAQRRVVTMKEGGADTVRAPEDPLRSEA